MFPTIASYLRVGVRPGLTIGKSILLLGYFGIMLYAGLYGSNPFSDPVRAGFLAASQIPVIVALGTKNNIVGMLIGFGYERVSILMMPEFVLHPLPFRRLAASAQTAVAAFMHHSHFMYAIFSHLHCVLSCSSTSCTGSPVVFSSWPPTSTPSVTVSFSLESSTYDN